MSMKINQPDKESQIRELLDLTMRVANETNRHVNFEFTAAGSRSYLCLYVISPSGEIEKHFIVHLTSGYEYEKTRGFSQAKKALGEILEG